MTEDEQKPKKPGLLNRFATYVQKNQEANRKAGVKSLTEEASELGSEWASNLTKGMARVGDAEEAKLTGRKPNIVNDDDGLMDEILFGKKPTKTSGKANLEESDTVFIQRLCEFLRYVNEDDDVELYQHRGTGFTKVDSKYLSKLLTRYLGYKVLLRERDLSIK